MQSFSSPSHCSRPSLVVMNPTFKTCFQDAGPTVKLFKLLFNWSLKIFNWSLIIPISSRQTLLRADTRPGLLLRSSHRTPHWLPDRLLLLKKTSEKGPVSSMWPYLSHLRIKMVNYNWTISSRSSSQYVLPLSKLFIKITKGSLHLKKKKLWKIP